jgi:hypothetical protein
MRKPRVFLAAWALSWLLLAAPPTYGWNRTGHRAAALIAYRQLDEGTRQKVAALLRKNPAAYDLWTGKMINSDVDPAADAFMQASTFADDVRPPSRFSAEFHRATHHYVTFRIATGDADKAPGEPPADGENLLTAYRKHLETLTSTDASVTAEKKAIALCWIFHLEGDIHQPLHAVSRFSNAFPQGDRGGNLVHPFPNPRGSRPYSRTLHAYWDDLLGDDDRVKTFDDLTDRVEVLLNQFPRSSFTPSELKEVDVRAWTLESVDAARETVYRDLDPEVTSLDALPVVYEAEAQKLGRRRIALAGYRLAEVLKGLFGESKD